ncbi:MAG: hypothetical protein KUL82_09220 [Bdellovibrio sp.]|nr:hypothetical protein [Bdellovibrio sp.]
MKTPASIFRAIFSALLILSSISYAQAASERTGLKDLTPEEDAILKKNKVKKVRPNDMGLGRINQERKKQGLPPLKKEEGLPEYETESGGAANSQDSGVLATSGVPAQVDNSTLVAFPSIANQGNQSSCVAFASTYYLASHEICLALGCDNKTAGQKVLSPKWTYNLINGGVDAGARFSDAFAVMNKHGAPLNVEYPYDSDFKAWSLNSTHWKGALNSRLSTFAAVAVNTDTGMANLKQILLNGHVVMVGTYINSWVYKTVGSGPFAGEKIVTHLNGTLGGHAMTIVGYDDGVWTDINGNGLVEAGEMGAFKIANSWGANWGNKGFAWASYDAFRTTSTVPSWSVTGRLPLTQGTSVYFATYTATTPKALAEVTLSHALRSQISLQFGSSANTQLSPTSTWVPFAFANVGGDWAFDGASVEKEGTFYFDISSLVGTDLNTQMFYLTLKDNVAGSALQAKSFKIVDPQVGNTLYAANNVPMFVDAGTGTLNAGNYNPGDVTAPSVPQNFVATLNYYKVGKTTKARTLLSWSASTDNVGVAKYRIYRNGVKLTETTSLSYTDTSISKGVRYIYEVTALDSKGNESGKSSSLTILW